MNHVIELDDEIYLNDAYSIAEWLDNEDITRYITEGREIGQEIRSALRYTTCPILTHLFCSNGNFYMIKHNGRSIGYLKLIDKGAGQAEIVVVIGDQNMWNKGFGTIAVQLALKECFFRLRYEYLLAKIMTGNEGSCHLFQKAGFRVVSQTERFSAYGMELSQYLAMAA